MAKQIYIDENGNEVLVSGTITDAGNLPLGSDFTDPTSTAYAINGKAFILSSTSTWHDVSSNITAGDYYDTTADGLYILTLAAIDTRAAEWSINSTGIIANTTSLTVVSQAVYLKSGTRLTTRNISGQIYQVRGYWT